MLHGTEQSWIDLARYALFLSGALLCSTTSAQAGLITGSSSEFLVIATGEGTRGDEFAAFQMSNVEIGADQEIISNSSVGGPSQRVGSFTGGLDLTGTFVPNDGANATFSENRWNDVDPDHGGDTVGIPDWLPGSRPIFEGIDFSGNVAIVGELAKFESSNADVNADVGIVCNRAPGDCFPNPSSENSFFEPGAPNTEKDLNALEGVSQFNPATLTDELEGLRDFIVGLPSDTTFTSGFTNINIKDSGAPQVTDLDAIDAAGVQDGFAVIDIELGDMSFLVNNTDWILNTAFETLAIFRMKEGTQFDFSNASILMGDGTGNSTDIINSLGAIFFIDAFQGTNEVFNLNNVILGGIGLWDFTDYNPTNMLLSSVTSVYNPAFGDNTVINLQDAQGCAQFIGHQVLMSNNRWTRCAYEEHVEVSEPPQFLLICAALGLLLFTRRRFLQRNA